MTAFGLARGQAGGPQRPTGVPSLSPMPARANVVGGGDPVSVLFCCDPSYFQHLAVAAVSLLENNPDAVFQLYVWTTARDEREEGALRRSLAAYGNASLIVRLFDRDRCRRLHVSEHISAEAYIRLFAGELLPETVTRVLYLDADLVVLGDVRPLWTMDLAGHVMAAVPDPFGAYYGRVERGLPIDQPYVSSGVLLIDLEAWRTRRLTEQLIAYATAEASSLLQHDQDALNTVLAREIAVIGFEWNFQARMFRIWPWQRRKWGTVTREIEAAAKRPRILHYTNVYKPWRLLGPVERADLYFSYLSRTAWRQSRPRAEKWHDVLEYGLNRLLLALGIDYALVRIPKGYLLREALRLARQALSGRRQARL